MLRQMSYNASTLWLLALLAMAVVYDLRQHRIPNWLTLGGFLFGLGLQAGFVGWSGVLTGIGGLAVALLFFLPGYMLHAMGAADVKLAAAAGVLLGPLAMFLAACFSLIVGGVIALLVLWRYGGLRAAGARYRSSLQLLVTTGQIGYVPPQACEAAAMRFPYAVAIASGTLVALWWVSDLQAFLEVLWTA